MRSLLLLGLATSVLAAADSPDDKFDSENKSQTVRRKSVLKESQKPDLPYTASAAAFAGQTLVPATDVKKLIGLDGHDVLVDGTVGSTFIPKGNKLLILNVGKDYKTCFKVVIDDGDFSKWGTKKPELIGKMYEGKRIVVSGWVSLYQDLPQVRTALPSQIQVVE